MKKIILLIILLIPFNVFAESFPELYSEKYIVYDITDSKILESERTDERSNIASLTKIMTTITAIEKIDDLDEEVLITEEVFNGLPWDASVAGLVAGDVLTLRDLLYASILPSGADATQALAIHLSGSVASFVDDMNTLAQEIGMTSSHFVNVTGLDIDDHYSTLEDLLKLLLYSLKNPTFKEVYTTRSYTMTNGKTVRSSVEGYNRLMNLDTSRILGSKTGFTDDAGLCISALFESSGHEMLLITLGAEYIYGRYYNILDALNIIEYIDYNYSYQELLSAGSVIQKLPVELSTIDNYDIKNSEAIELFLKDDYDVSKFNYVYEGIDDLSFTDENGTVLGTVSYYYDNELIKTEEIVLDRDINIDFVKVFFKYQGVIIISLGVVVVIVFISRRKKRKKRKKRY